MNAGLVIRKDDRNKGIAVAVAIIGLMFLFFFVFTYSIPDPPIEEVPVLAETEMTEIDLKEYVVKVGSGGGGSGTPVKAPVTNQVTPQVQKVLTNPRGTTTVPKGGSNHTNTNKPNDNKASTTEESNNPFGSGGTGGGDGGGRGHGFGGDTGDGTGPGTGPGSGGDVKRYLVNKPNTYNIDSDENCKIVLRVQVDADGNIVGKPAFVKAASSTNNMTLINQVIYVVQSEAKFNAVKGAKLKSEVITISISAN